VTSVHRHVRMFDCRRHDRSVRLIWNMFSWSIACCWWSTGWQCGGPATAGKGHHLVLHRRLGQGWQRSRKSGVCRPHEPRIGRSRTSRTQASPPNRVRPVVTEKRGRISRANPAGAGVEQQLGNRAQRSVEAPQDFQRRELGRIWTFGSNHGVLRVSERRLGWCRGSCGAGWCGQRRGRPRVRSHVAGAARCSQLVSVVVSASARR
jgi:hypothetical protein